MWLNDLLVLFIYFVLIGVIAGVGWSVLPKEFKNAIKKLIKIVYKKSMKKNEKQKKKE